MKITKILIPLVAVAIGGVFLLCAVNKFKSYDRTVSVRGLCEREVKADIAIYPISYQENGDDLLQLYNTVNEKNKIIVDFLKTNGIAESEISIKAPSVEDRINNYNYKSRYNLTSIVTVYTDKVDTVLALQSKLATLLEKGIALNSGNGWENPVEYNFVNLNKIKPEMIEEANKNARTAAEQFAKDTKSHLGKIQTANQGLFSIENRDNNTPYIKTVRVVTYVTYYLR